MLAGYGAFDGLEICLELAPPSGRRLRLVVGLRLRFPVGLGVPAALEFGAGFPGCFPGGVGVGGPLLVSGVADFEPLPFGDQLRGEGTGAGRTGFVVLGLGVRGLLQGVGFDLRGEAQWPAYVRRGGGLGAFAVRGFVTPARRGAGHG